MCINNIDAVHICARKGRPGLAGARHRRDRHQPTLCPCARVHRARLQFDGIRIAAMLLRTDFDHAASRVHLFAGCPMFAKKVVLTRPIRWFEGSTGSPSFNHCWMIWDRQHQGPATLAYAF
jgi:hypothetical protein